MKNLKRLNNLAKSAHDNYLKDEENIDKESKSNQYDVIKNLIQEWKQSFFLLFNNNNNNGNTKINNNFFFEKMILKMIILVILE